MIKKKAVIITFSTKTDKNSDRTKFFKQLYGWEQTIPGKKKNYEYHREGFLEKIRHKKVAQSSFIVPEDEFDKVMEFFEQWHKEVITNAFKILLEDQDIFEEFDRQMRELDEQENEEEEIAEEDEQGLSEEEEKNILKRHKEWQKKKLRSV